VGTADAALEAKLADAGARIEAGLAALAAAWAAQEAALARAAAPGGVWRKAADPESGEAYYFHSRTKETTWDRPDEYDSDVDAAAGQLRAGEGAADADAGAAEEGVGAGAGRAPGLVMGDVENEDSGVRTHARTFPLLPPPLPYRSRPLWAQVNTLGSLDAKEVLEYAVYLGIEPAREPHLLWIAEEGMHAPLPEVLPLPPPPRQPHRPASEPRGPPQAVVVSAARGARRSALGARQGFSEHTDANGEVYFFNAATQVLKT